MNCRNLDTKIFLFILLRKFYIKKLSILTFFYAQIARVTKFQSQIEINSKYFKL